MVAVDEGLLWSARTGYCCQPPMTFYRCRTCTCALGGFLHFPWATAGCVYRPVQYVNWFVILPVIHSPE